jgi:hypothetical protein
MKKISLLFILAFCSMMTTKAQIPDGFYHIKNADTGRYLSLNDTNPENYPVNKTSGSVNLAGIRTYLNYDSVSVSPSCVIFIKSLGNGQYDLAGQGSSFYEMTSHKLPIDIKEVSNGVYILSGTHSGFTKELMDRSPSDEDGYIMGSGSSGMNRWNIIPINTTNEFIGIRPDIKTSNGGYFGTIYAGFNFKLVSPGMAAFYVSNAGGSSFTLEEIKDEVIPFATPVIIRCNSANPEDNKIEPIAGGYNSVGMNFLGGVYCSLVGVAGHTNVTPYNPSTMRVLGLDSKGEIAFINAKDRPELLVTDRYGAQYLRGNKAYLKVNPGDADVMTIGGTGIKDIKSVTSTSGSIYTLTGVRLPEGITPKSGVYIKGGKKMIIK